MFPPIQNRKKLLALSQAFAVVLAVVLASGWLLPAFAQEAKTQAPSAQQQPAPPEAGGPQGDVGPLALPKKKDEPPPEKTPPVKNPAGMPEYSLRVDVPLVQVPVLVTTKDGQFIPGLKKENFRVLEDGVPQKITSMSQTSDAPITAVMLVEFAAKWYQLNYDALNASYSFANSLKPNDWVAAIYYDIKPHLLTDFTQDKRQIYSALAQLRIPLSGEINTWDALYDTIDRLNGVEGRKYVILIGSGLDTFSKVRYDQILKKVKETRNITVFTVGTGFLLHEWFARAASMSGNLGYTFQEMDFTQAENALNSIARMTGGRYYEPRFESQMPEIFNDIAQAVRNQYNLAYRPTNSKQDGTYRKLKVELVGENGQPLKVHDQKGKDVKFQIIAREGYNAKHEVE